MISGESAPRRCRDSSVELFRIFLAVGIIGIHAANTKVCPIGWIFNSSLWCVDGFVFISGWYGIRFAPSKIFRLWGTGLSCAAIGVCATCLVDADFCFFWPRFWNVFCSYWFLHAYVVLLLVSPLINQVFESKRTRESDLVAVSCALPILFLCFCWSYLNKVPLVRDVPIPYPVGLGTYIWLTLAAVYIFARLVRRFSLLDVLGSKRIFWAFVVALPLAACGFGEYDSPVAPIIALAVFASIKKIRLGPLVSRAVGVVSVSAFSVYLIQDPFFRWPYISRFQEWLMQYCPNRYAVWTCSVLVVLLVCLVLDIFRRMVARLSIFKAICHKVDRSWTRVCEKIHLAMAHGDREGGRE